MTLVPEKKKCPNCGRIYSWNPDVGKFRCPYCKSNGLEMPGKPVKLTFDVENADDWFKEQESGNHK